MRKNVFSTMAKHATSVAIALTVVACNTKPDEAVDETKNKLHEDPARMELVLTEVNTAQSWEELSKTGKLAMRNKTLKPYLTKHKQVKVGLHLLTVQASLWYLLPNKAPLITSNSQLLCTHLL